MSQLLTLLSPREFEVAGLVACGMSNKQIGVALSLSEHSVKNYIFRIFDKAGCESRAALAVRFAKETQKVCTRGDFVRAVMAVWDETVQRIPELEQERDIAVAWLTKTWTLEELEQPL